MPRTIEIYEKEGDDFINQIEFLHDDLDFFRSIFDYPQDDPLMYFGYKIEKDHNIKIFEKFGIMVDIDKYDCFVDYYE
ncbi:DUF7683 domain-containing protein [Candidatus Phyllobacterium onerii]|uniref:DUF7683 domain-containing protein n=1 Tax=Candidatus Phyllobacterium onerii TaxID=3020828 RepID=UPI00232BEBC7|nr:hypothetical protein [Phyllobacterium sp. IY22]